MNESGAVEKMRELMLSVETLRRFYSIRSVFPRFLLVGLLYLLLAVTVASIFDLYAFFTGYPYLGEIPIGQTGSFSTNFVYLGLLIAANATLYLILKKAYEIQVSRGWEEDLKDGAVGIIKIIADHDWEEVLLQLRGAKQGFVLVAVLQLLLNFLLTSIIAFFSLGFLFYYTVGFTINGYFILALSAVIALVIGDKTLKVLYGRLWSADILIGELRRFRSDFAQREI